MPRCPQCESPVSYDDDACFQCGMVLSTMYASTTPPRGRHPDDHWDEPPRRPRRARRDDYYDERESYPPRRRDHGQRGYDDAYYGGAGAGFGAGAGAGAGAADNYYDRPPPRSRDGYDDYPRERGPSRNSRRREQQAERPPQRSNPRPNNKSSSGSSAKTVVASIVALMLILLLFAVIFLPEFEGFRNDLTNLQDEIPLNPFVREYPEGAEYEVDRVVSVSASGQFTYTIKMSSPMDIESGSDTLQDLQVIQSSRAPNEGLLEIDGTQNNMLIWEDTISGGRDTVTLSYTVKTKTMLWEMDGSQSGTVADIDQAWKDAYNHDEWLIDTDGDGVLDPEDDLDNDGQWDYRIEPSNPQIKAIADQVTSGKTNVYDKVLAAYEYLISDEALEYETIRGSGLPKACTTTLADGKGDCDDYSILLISVLRAADIPARLHLGALYDPNGDQWIGHGWAGVYIPLEAGGAFMGTIDIVNKQFLFRDPYRITDWFDTGGDIIEKGEAVSNLDFYYYSFSYVGSGTKESEDYNTISYKPYGRVVLEMSDAEITGQPSDDSDSGGRFGPLPGFEAVGTLAAIGITAVALHRIRRTKI